VTFQHRLKTLGNLVDIPIPNYKKST